MKRHVPFTSVSVDPEIQRMRDRLNSGESIIVDVSGPICCFPDKETSEINHKLIECTCNKCDWKTSVDKDSDVYEVNFLRCSKCGYIIGPIKMRVPSYWADVYDDRNNPESYRRFWNIDDAKDYVKLCGLSEEQLHRIGVMID